MTISADMDRPSNLGHSRIGDGPRFAAIEAGGTKFNVAIGGSDGKLYSRAQFSTRSPDETIKDVISWLDSEAANSGLFGAIGLASFGPIDTDPRSLTWGQLGMTPKLSWQHANLIEPFRHYGVPLALDTDVNGAALAEWRWGAGRGSARICYLTVGTGIGGGAVLDGKMLSGRSHPEMGHMFVRRYPDDDFIGTCPSHADCLEGLTSGSAIQARWGVSLSKLEAGHPGHQMIANYLAQACINVVSTLAPEKIILGGGVIGTSGLIDRIHEQFEKLASGYFAGFAAKNIAQAELFPISGLIGALAMAEDALTRSQS